MKKVLLAFTLLVTSSVFAQDCRRGVDHKHPSCYNHVQYNHHRHNHNQPVIVHRDNDWVGPAIVTIIGGAVIADIISRNRNETVIVQQPPVQQLKQCTPWTETWNSDGTVTRTRTCSN